MNKCDYFCLSTVTIILQSFHGVQLLCQVIKVFVIKNLKLIKSSYKINDVTTIKAFLNDPLISFFNVH